MSDFTVDTLMALRSDEFIRTAYRILLGREVDEHGFDFYKQRLRSGVDRAAVIDDLAGSAEGRAHAANLPGLEALRQRERWLKIPLLGNILCRLWTGCSKSVLRRINGVREQVQEASPSTAHAHYGHLGIFWGDEPGELLFELGPAGRGNRDMILSCNGRHVYSGPIHAGHPGEEPSMAMRCRMQMKAGYNILAFHFPDANLPGTTSFAAVEQRDASFPHFSLARDGI